MEGDIDIAYVPSGWAFLVLAPCSPDSPKLGRSAIEKMYFDVLLRAVPSSFRISI
jgi:hypothetical protein